MIKTALFATCLLLGLSPIAFASETCAPDGSACVTTSSSSFGSGTCDSGTFYFEHNSVGVNAHESNTNTFLFASASSYCYHSSFFGSGAGDQISVVSYLPDGSIQYVYVFWTDNGEECATTVYVGANGNNVPPQSAPCAAGPVMIPALP